MPRCHTGNGNAGGFDGQDFVDAVVFKNSIEFGANLIQQSDVKLMVQKAIYFKYVSGTNLSVLQNPLFQKFHFHIPLSILKPLCRILSFFSIPKYKKCEFFCVPVILITNCNQTLCNSLTFDGKAKTNYVDLMY